jgi:ABC-type uncharacterized transport system auxiliary subunit
MTTLVALLLTACGSVQKPTETFTLVHPSAGIPKGAARPQTCILVPDAAAYGVFGEACLIERRGVRLVRDVYQQWSPLPGQMTAVAMADALNANGRVSAIVGRSGDAQWLLLATIRDWSYSRGSNGLVARIALDVQLVDQQRRQTVLSRSFACHTIARAATYDAIVHAFRATLDQLSMDCSAAVHAAVRE